MLIEITKNDIQQGSREIGEDCPVTLALRRYTKVKTISVSANCAWVGRKCHELPPEVRDFLSKYDRKKPVEPMSFQLASYGESL